MAIEDEPYAGQYWGGIDITATVMEGTITVSTSTQHVQSGVLGDRVATLGAEVVKGDLVKPNVWAASEMNACHGMFAVEKADADNDFCIGRVKNNPKWYSNIPSSSTTIASSANWATALAAGSFRYVTIQLWATAVFVGEADDATGSNIVAGNAVQPTAAGADTWELATDTTSGKGLVFDDGAAYSSTTTVNNSQLATFISLSAANLDDEHILIAAGLTPAAMIA